MTLCLCQIALPILSGLLIAIAFPPFDVWWVAWIALVPLGLSVSLSRHIIEPLIGAFLGCALLHLIGLDWIRSSFQGSGVSGPYAFAWLATAFLFGPAWLIAVGILHTLFHRLALSMSVALPAGWIACDFSRRAIALFFTETDFPWLQLAATQTHLKYFIQIVDVIGACGASALLAFASGALCDILVARRCQKARAALIACVVLLCVFGYGALRLSQVAHRNGPTVCLMPWNELPGAADPTKLRGVADILLWTEAAIEDDGVSDLPRRLELERFARETDAVLAIGWRRTRPAFSANSLAVVHPKGGIAICDKTCLVPWMEFSPWIKMPFIPWAGRTHRAGTTHHTFSCAGARIAPAICYDICFSSLLRRFESPGCFLVASSETFDQTGCLQRHVTQLVRLNAIQLRKAIVRNVRGGHSGIVDGSGRVQCDLKDLRSPTVVGPVPIDNRFSLYAKFGDAVLLVPIALLGAFHFFRKRSQFHAWLQVCSP